MDKQPCPGCGSTEHDLPKPQNDWYIVAYKIRQQRSDDYERQLRLNGEVAP